MHYQSIPVDIYIGMILWYLDMFLHSYRLGWLVNIR